VKDKNNFKVLSRAVLSDTEREQRSEGLSFWHVYYYEEVKCRENGRIQSVPDSKHTPSQL